MTSKKDRQRNKLEKQCPNFPPKTPSLITDIVLMSYCRLWTIFSHITCLKF